MLYMVSCNTCCFCTIYTINVTRYVFFSWLILFHMLVIILFITPHFQTVEIHFYRNVYQVRITDLCTYQVKGITHLLFARMQTLIGSPGATVRSRIDYTSVPLSKLKFCGTKCVLINTGYFLSHFYFTLSFFFLAVVQRNFMLPAASMRHCLIYKNNECGTRNMYVVHNTHLLYLNQ